MGFQLVRHVKYKVTVFVLALVPSLIRMIGFLMIQLLFWSFERFIAVVDHLPASFLFALLGYVVACITPLNLTNPEFLLFKNSELFLKVPILVFTLKMLPHLPFSIELFLALENGTAEFLCLVKVLNMHLSTSWILVLHLAPKIADLVSECIKPVLQIPANIHEAPCLILANWVQWRGALDCPIYVAMRREKAMGRRRWPLVDKVWVLLGDLKALLLRMSQTGLSVWRWADLGESTCWVEWLGSYILKERKHKLWGSLWW